MEEEFYFDFSDDAQRSVERYEEMIRNQDQYFLMPRLLKILLIIISRRVTL